MTHSHTPAPWQCKPSHTNDAGYAVYRQDGNFLTIDDSEHEANARLIAAAPELLAELKALVKANNGQPSGVYVSALDNARAIITKTEGKA